MCEPSELSSEKYDAKDEGSKIFLEAMDVRTFRVVLRDT